MRALLFAVPLLLANADDPTAIPEPVKSMLDAAMASGNEGEVATIVKYAKNVMPDNAAAIVKVSDDWRNKRRLAAERHLRESNFFDLVKGRAEFGGFITEGNTDAVGVTAAVEVRREGFQWRHKVRLRADYQETTGVVTQERYLAAYEPNYKINDRAYIYGAVQYERDRFSGFDDRFSVSTGAGYSAIKKPNMRLDVELGPAFRHTRFIDDSFESNFAARGSLDFNWKLNQAVSLQQNASAYLQDANSTVSTRSALLAKLFGPFSAQLSYTMQYESTPPIGRQTTDTTSRAALVVDF